MQLEFAEWPANSKRSAYCIGEPSANSAALKFEFDDDVLEVLGGTIMQVLRGHSSKEVAQVFEDVIKDPGKATARVKESRLHDLVIRTLSEQVSIDASDPIAKLSGLEQLQPRGQECASCIR